MEPTERRLLIILARIVYRHGTEAEQRKIDDLLSKVGKELAQ